MDLLVKASRCGVETSGWLYASDSSVRRSSCARAALVRGVKGEGVAGSESDSGAVRGGEGDEGCCQRQRGTVALWLWTHRDHVQHVRPGGWDPRRVQQDEQEGCGCEAGRPHHRCENGPPSTPARCVRKKRNMEHAAHGRGNSGKRLQLALERCYLKMGAPSKKLLSLCAEVITGIPSAKSTAMPEPEPEPELLWQKP